MSINFESSPAPGPSLFAVPSLRLGDAEQRINDYIDKNIVNWFIQEVLDPTKKLATSRGHSQKFIDALTVVKLAPLKVALALEEIWGPNQIPLHDMLEEGWGEGGYEIYGNPYNAWTDQSGSHVINSKTKPIFHPGFRGYNIKESVYNWGFIERFQQRIVDETTDYMEKVKFR